MKQMQIMSIFLITQGILTVGHVYRTNRWERQNTIAQQLQGEYDQLMDNKDEFEQQLYVAKSSVKKFALNQLKMRAIREDQVRTLPA